MLSPEQMDEIFCKEKDENYSNREFDRALSDSLLKSKEFGAFVAWAEPLFEASPALALMSAISFGYLMGLADYGATTTPSKEAVNA